MIQALEALEITLVHIIDADHRIGLDVIPRQAPRVDFQKAGGIQERVKQGHLADMRPAALIGVVDGVAEGPALQLRDALKTVQGRFVQRLEVERFVAGEDGAPQITPDFFHRPARMRRKEPRAPGQGPDGLRVQSLRKRR